MDTIPLNPMALVRILDTITLLQILRFFLQGFTAKNVKIFSKGLI